MKPTKKALLIRSAIAVILWVIFFNCCDFMLPKEWDTPLCLIAIVGTLLTVKGWMKKLGVIDFIKGIYTE